MSAIEVKVPDIGDFKDIPVIDIMAAELFEGVCTDLPPVKKK